MINVCAKVDEDKNLITVPVKLNDISKVKNANVLMETLYLGNKLGFSHT